MAAQVTAADGPLPEGNDLGQEPTLRESHAPQGLPALPYQRLPPPAAAPPAPEQPPLPPGPGPPGAPALEALERRVAAALRAMQSRHEASLDDAVQVLVGQLWAAYFSIGSLQAHQQALQTQLQQLMQGGVAAALPLAGAVAGVVGGVGDRPQGAVLQLGDSLVEDSSSVSLSGLGGGPECTPMDTPRPAAAGGCQAQQQETSSACKYALRSGAAAAHGAHCGGGHCCCGAPVVSAAAPAEGLPLPGAGKAGEACPGADGEAAESPRPAKTGKKRNWAGALRKERAKRRRLEREVRELRGLLEQLLPGVLRSAQDALDGGGDGGGSSGGTPPPPSP